ncbi:MAG: SCP2 sterol-binding domain-containing protein [Thermoplasmata archaeon]
MVEELLRRAIEKFNRKTAEDRNLAEELAGMRRTVQIEVSDDATYHFLLESARVGGLQKGALERPDIRVIASSDTLRQLWSRELRPMKALATRKLQIKGSIEDMLRLRKFF